MDGKTHRVAGGVSGTVWALFQAREQDLLAMALEGLGGYYGGRAGAQLPDVLNPADTPNHRRFAHSVAVGLGVVAAGRRLTPMVANELRQRAAAFRAAASNPDISLGEGVLYALAYALCHFVAGVVNGLPAGYASHLMLDAATPAGLPLLIGPARAGE